MSQSTILVQLPLFPEKTCTTCHRPKPIDAFHKHSLCAGGYNTVCKDCERAYKQAHYKRNHTAIRAKQDVYYAANRAQINAKRRKGQRPKLSREELKRRLYERLRRWERNNPEKVKASKRGWLARNPERQRAAERAWKRANPERVLLHTKRRQALKKRVTVMAITPEQRRARLFLYGAVCAYCGRAVRTDVPRSDPEKATEDHQIPLSRGGPHCLSNLRLSCYACNCLKGTRTATGFRRWLAAARAADLPATMALSQATGGDLLP